MRVRIIAVTVLLAVALPGLAGCDKVDAYLNPKPKVVTQEATVAVAGANVSGTVEAEMPQGLPLWPDAVATASTTSHVPGGTTWATSFTTTDAYDDVFKGMGAGFQRAGWTVETEDIGTPEAKAAVFTVSKDNIEGAITITDVAPGQVTIDYVMGPKK